SDLKRMVAYTSVSHMGFVLLGIFSLDGTALQGVVLQIVCHGISTGALFILAGAIQERLRTRELRAMGGLWGAAPRMGAATLIFALASLGLPGLGNFAAEFLILVGTFRSAPVFAVLAALGLVASTIYALGLFQRIFFGPRSAEAPFRDLSPRETGVLAALALAIVWLGLYPQPVLDTSRAAVEGIRSAAMTGPGQGIASTLPASPSDVRSARTHVAGRSTDQAAPVKGDRL
ncbi:MAG TPA: proton-conducting transporter membrane subunit, partial [Acidobacteriota bacterium]|nr:proton-conducting transporter membrane subunit [Acidobacteriota bacterium]